MNGVIENQPAADGLQNAERRALVCLGIMMAAQAIMTFAAIYLSWSGAIGQHAITTLRAEMPRAAIVEPPQAPWQGRGAPATRRSDAGSDISSGGAFMLP